METALKLFIFQFAVYVIITSIFYFLLRRKNIIPDVRHPYTNKKDGKIVFDFYNLMLFLTFATVFLVRFLWIPSLILFLLSIMQGYMLHLYIKQKQDEKVILTIEYDDHVFNKWQEASKENGKKNKGKTLFISTKENKLRTNKKPTKKIIVTDNFVYFGKKARDKIRIVPSFQKNFYLQDIKEEEDYIVLSYGAMGSPMFKRYLYFPPEFMKKERKVFKKEIETIIKKQNT